MAILAAPASARADQPPPGPPSKQACLDAHAGSQEKRNDKQLKEAKQRLLICNDAACPGLVREACAALIAEVDSAMPSMAITVTRGGSTVVDATVKVDGGPWGGFGVAREVDPGTHEVTVEVPGAPAVKRLVTALEGQKNQAVVIELAPTGPTQTPERSLLPPVASWVFFGGTLAVLGVGLGFEGWAASENADIEAGCRGLDEAACDEREETKDWRQKHLVANISYGVAGALALSGIVIWIVDASRDPAPATSVRIDPSQGLFLSVEHRF
ncbi:MAG: hypothetical protein JNK04_10090 [Myxococcales bacterium]|nr:hypothetical protein [Myxococcales bacterium]